MRIGVDAGGTFTDFVVLHDDGRLETFKIRSNPRDPAQVILAGLERAAGKRPADVVHGSTVATNALLERKGARTAFVTTAGFEDLVHIGRQNRPELYNLTPDLPRFLVPGEMCFGVGERAFYDGTIERSPSPDELAALAKRLRRAKTESVAICFLHSYRVFDNERLAANALENGPWYVCASHEISPEFREYERASTTLINAYVGPLMRSYLDRLAEESAHRIVIMQSNGGSLSAAEASRHAVRTVLSGPAGGVVGAARMAALSGYDRALGFDMGGTSTDVSLIDRAPHETTEAYIDGMPIRVPMLDIQTVGAGGGSIARVDAGGLLRVGPESAGADPGPACYGTGESATVTDAHVVLGRISEQQFLGGAMRIDPGRAEAAVARVGETLGMNAVDTAAGIVRVSNANMERAIRMISVERGYDPRDFALLAFGGCGGLHACDIAEELGIRAILVPEQAGALSALGMLLADRIRDYSAGVLNVADVEKQFRQLEKRAKSELRSARLERSADIRYQGQSYELNVPWQPANTAQPFHAAHQRTYGYSRPDAPVEVVTIRVRAIRETPKPALAGIMVQPGSHPFQERRCFVSGRWKRVPVFQREDVGRRASSGPALVLDYGSTTLINTGWKLRRDNAGTVIIERAQHQG
jgi:N-methylhydantoinase A/oxoprolinase/acetone carboxylase beta subunit